MQAMRQVHAPGSDPAPAQTQVQTAGGRVASPSWQPLGDGGASQWLVKTDDPDVQALWQPDWQLQYDQLSGGAFSGQVHHIQLPGLRLVREDSNRALHQRGAIDPGAYGMAMPLAMSGPALFNGQVVTHDKVMVGRGDVLDLVTPDQFCLIAVVVDQALLRPLWQHMYQKDLSTWLAMQLVLPARAAAAHAVREMHLQTMARLGAAPLQPLSDAAMLRLRDTLLMEWIEALPETVHATPNPVQLRRKQLVRRACELMLAQGDEPPSMLQLCQQVGASRRQLNYCFQEVLGVSPLKYLRALRLGRVRRELRGGGVTVQDAAGHSGFWHLGQFARDYRALFDELPSATLKRAG